VLAIALVATAFAPALAGSTGGLSGSVKDAETSAPSSTRK
jgi:hypothetical protein